MDKEASSVYHRQGKIPKTKEHLHTWLLMLFDEDSFGWLYEFSWNRLVLSMLLVRLPTSESNVMT